MTDPEPSLEELVAGMPRYAFYAIHMVPTERWSSVSPDDLRLHLLWMREQESNGVVLLAGPLDQDRRSGSGLCIIRAASRDRAEEIASSDPFHREGFRSNTVQTWTVNEGAVSLKVTLSTRHSSLA